jgi:predicted dehydrogenase
MPSNGESRSLRFLILGCGSIGKRHLSNIAALNAGELLAYDICADRLGEVESRFQVKTFDDLEDTWKEKPDIAFITLPTSLHVPFSLKAAEHGCHLFVEKPLSDRLDGVEQLLNTVRERNLVTLVGCNMRFHPGLAAVKRLIEQGAIGRVMSARVAVGQYLPDWHPWEDYRQGYSARRDLGGGIILDAIHEIDYIRWMLGEVEAVACFAGKLSDLDIETEDTAGILLRFTNGAIGEVHMDYIQRVPSRSCHIIGDQGTIHWDEGRGEVRWYSVKTGDWQVITDPPDWEFNQMYLSELSHFLQCLSGKEKPVLDLFEGKQVLEVALAAKTSAESGQVLKLKG